MNDTLRLDPRTVLFLLLLSPVVMALQVNLFTEVLTTVLYLLPFLLVKKYRSFWIFLLIYSLQVFSMRFIVPHLTNLFFLYIFSLLSNGFRRMMLSIIGGAYAVQATYISEWLALFKKWHLPKFIIVPAAVIMRFFPTLRQDYHHIRQAMAFRGIGRNFTDLLKHPIQSFEYLLVPLLINASQIASDLTISALTKGLSRPEKQTSMVQIRLTWWDWTYMGLVVLPLILYLGGVLV